MKSKGLVVVGLCLWSIGEMLLLVVNNWNCFIVSEWWCGGDDVGGGGGMVLDVVVDLLLLLLLSLRRGVYVVLPAF